MATRLNGDSVFFRRKRTQVVLRHTVVRRITECQIYIEKIYEIVEVLGKNNK